MRTPADNHVLVRLSKEEALVLFELVSRFTDKSELTIEDQAEERVLWDICALLEKQLVEPFRPDYGPILDEARKLVRDEKEA